jgi:hypothetical protein
MKKKKEKKIEVLPPTSKGEKSEDFNKWKKEILKEFDYHKEKKKELEKLLNCPEGYNRDELWDTMNYHTSRMVDIRRQVDLRSSLVTLEIKRHLIKQKQIGN